MALEVTRTFCAVTTILARRQAIKVQIIKLLTEDWRVTFVQARQLTSTRQISSTPSLQTVRLCLLCSTIITHALPALLRSNEQSSKYFRKRNSPRHISGAGNKAKLRIIMYKYLRELLHTTVPVSYTLWEVW